VCGSRISLLVSIVDREAFRAGEGVDLISESVRLVMQELIETEASEQIGADRYQRTSSRVTDRNGSRPRLVASPPRPATSSCGSRSCGRVRSSRRFWNRDGGSIRPSMRW
jgi:Transposase, Mutator family